MQTEFFERLDDLSQESRHQLDTQIRKVQDEARRLKAQARRLRQAQQAEVKKRRGLLEQMALSTREWGQETVKRSGELAQNLKEDVGENLAQQGSQVVQQLADWGDDATSQLRKQRRKLTRNVSDWSDDAGDTLLKQSKQLQRNLRKRGRNLSRDLADRGEETSRKLRKRGRNLAHDLADRRDDVTKKLRKQGQQLSERGSNLVGQRDRNFWSILGFLAGLVLAGGVTYLLIRRSFSQNEQIEEEHFELPGRETLNGFNSRSEDEAHFVGGGRTAVASKTTTDVEKAIAFVGVLSTKQYYPIEQKPTEVTDLVFFETEDEARAEGFTPAS